MRKPEKKISCGPISASVWSKIKTIEGEKVKFNSITINKAYKDGEDWKHTNSFNIEDLPKVTLVANEVYKYIKLKCTNSDE